MKLRKSLLILPVIAIAIFSYFSMKTSKCPDNYLLLPNENICVAKYEMKKGPDNKALSLPEGLPWNDLNHQEAILACKNNGPEYDLISNDEWTAIARNIADVPSNWNTKKPFHGKLNIGHSDGVPDRFLETSADDHNACYLTGQECSSTIWNQEKRTHVLSSGEVIWDFAGNLAEWIKEINDKKQINAPQGYIGTIDPNDSRYQKFGPLKKCESDSSGQYDCGLGFYWTNDVQKNGMGRSGFWKHNSPFMSGIFSLGVDVDINRKYNFMGFRCVYHPKLFIK